MPQFQVDYIRNLIGLKNLTGLVWYGDWSVPTRDRR